MARVRRASSAGFDALDLCATRHSSRRLGSNKRLVKACRKKPKGPTDNGQVGEGMKISKEAGTDSTRAGHHGVMKCRHDSYRSPLPRSLMVSHVCGLQSGRSANLDRGRSMNFSKVSVTVPLVALKTYCVQIRGRGRAVGSYRWTKENGYVCLARMIRHDSLAAWHGIRSHRIIVCLFKLVRARLPEGCSGG